MDRLQRQAGLGSPGLMPSPKLSCLRLPRLLNLIFKGVVDWPAPAAKWVSLQRFSDFQCIVGRCLKCRLKFHDEIGTLIGRNVQYWQETTFQQSKAAATEFVSSFMIQIWLSDRVGMFQLNSWRVGGSSRGRSCLLLSGSKRSQIGVYPLYIYIYDYIIYINVYIYVACQMVFDKHIDALAWAGRSCHADRSCWSQHFDSDWRHSGLGSGRWGWVLLGSWFFLWIAVPTRVRSALWTEQTKETWQDL